MKIYESERCGDHIPSLVLLSHGPMCMAMIESAALIMDEVKNIAAFALEAGDDPEAYGNAVRNYIKKHGENVLMFVDLLGGTPSNQTMRILRESPTICALSGFNLTMLIEAIGNRECCSDPKKLAEQLIELGRNGIDSMTQIVQQILSDL